MGSVIEREQQSPNNSNSMLVYCVMMIIAIATTIYGVIKSDDTPTQPNQQPIQQTTNDKLYIMELETTLNIIYKALDPSLVKKDHDNQQRIQFIRYILDNLKQTKANIYNKTKEQPNE
jgi:hypothetical protein